MVAPWAGLPKTLKIGPFEILVEILVEIPRLPVDGRVTFGDWNSVEHRIRIKHDHPSIAAALDTVIHEIKHAIFTFFHVVPRDDEELLVSSLATAWTTVLLDNPQLVKWISKCAR